ncbi:hypothetical protein [Sphingobacterium sp. BIGb0116]|uniref:hypothetical protein n=1 Tax=Sphingobacterium sp. BIGb0116 TaxID=2940619 RepID=UPI00216A2310|nr:hypothetical protein [Sphingobacterium sp. BIGb0116]MCS4165182.1 hypothetical protein [Sphingobacterium sp. BIGb0116]
MLSKLLAIVFIFLVSINANAQKWQKENIDRVLEVSFPNKPIHFPVDEYGVKRFSCEKEGCLFSLSVKKDIVEDYYGYLLAADSTRESWAMATLNWVVDSKVNQPFHFLISKHANRLGYNDFGMDIVYATMQPSMQENNKRFSKLFLLGNSLYVFEVWYMDNERHDKIKDKFFKSIVINNK